MKKFISLFLVVLLLITFCSCGSNSSKQYLGKWTATKVATNRTDGKDNTEIVFSDYSEKLKMELTYEFSSDNHYTVHYYILGIEGKGYPKNGTFEIKGNKIILEDGSGEIENDILTIHFPDSQGKGEVIHYLTKVNE